MYIAVRIRPLTERDRAQPRFNGEVLKAQEKHIQVVPQNKYFTYDHVFGQETQQTDIFERLGQRPVQKFVEGMITKPGILPIIADILS
jgi:hypothetical protein